jgi:hypothetical protein
MLHGVGFNTPDTRGLVQKFLRERLDGMNTDHKRLCAIVAQRSRLARRDIRKLFLEAKTKDAPWSVEDGMVD